MVIGDSLKAWAKLDVHINSSLENVEMYKQTNVVTKTIDRERSLP